MDNTEDRSKDEFSRERPINYTGLLPIFLLLVVIIARISYELYKSKRQKTRSTPERRVYVGARPRPASYGQPEPTIYVSPANLPPPPKYEAMAPPSYEEVVGIHYPQYQQPIATPIVTALSHTSECRTNVVNPSSNVINPSSNVINPSSNVTDNESTVITVSTDERRTSVTVTSS